MSPKLCACSETSLALTEQRHRPKHCYICRSKNRFGLLASTEHIGATFATSWIKKLYKEWTDFLLQHDYSWNTKKNGAGYGIILFQEMEREFSSLEEIHQTWLQKPPLSLGHHFPHGAFRAFLIDKKILNIDLIKEQKRHKYCASCETPLTPTEQKHKLKSCYICYFKHRFNCFSSDQHIEAAFTISWIKKLYRDWIEFLVQHDVRWSTKMSGVVYGTRIFQEMEKQFSSPKEIQDEWVRKSVKRFKEHFPRGFFRNFLINKKILNIELIEEQKELKVLYDKIEEAPEKYKQLLKIYCEHKLSLRKWHLKQNASRPLAVRTIINDLYTYIRLVTWLLCQTTQNNVSGCTSRAKWC
ncbi:MAG TPA: hypothetical protein VFT64_04310 [Rickettsiales bacterium]|nr:hypothetical protein [Rickettsiales bacterium]